MLIIAVGRIAGGHASIRAASTVYTFKPESVDRVRVKQGLIFFGPDWPRATVDWAVDLFQKTMAEDKAVLVSLAAGLKSRHYEPGPLAPADCEGPIWDFYGYMNRRMGAALAAASAARSA